MGKINVVTYGGDKKSHVALFDKARDVSAELNYYLKTAGHVGEYDIRGRIDAVDMKRYSELMAMPGMDEKNVELHGGMCHHYVSEKAYFTSPNPAFSLSQVTVTGLNDDFQRSFFVDLKEAMSNELLGKKHDRTISFRMFQNPGMPVVCAGGESGQQTEYSIPLMEVEDGDDSFQFGDLEKFLMGR